MEQKPTKAVIGKVVLQGDVLGRESFEPTLINFFFGKNGSGKSTVAKQIGEYGLTQFRNGTNLGDYDILRYNEEFIIQNVQSYANIPGVFTITKEDAEAKAMLDKANADRVKAKREYDKATAGLEEISNKAGERNTAVITEVWKITDPFRKRFPEAQKYKNDKKKFFSWIFSIPAVDCEEDKIKDLYELAYKGAGREYRFFSNPHSAELPESPLLGKQIVSSSSTPFAEFVKALNNLSWVEHGHKNYPGDYCPYCQQRLPDTFEEDLASCYDEAYQSDMKGLQKFYGEYSRAFTDIYGMSSRGLENDFQCSQIAQFRDKLKILESTGRRNMELIQHKIQNPHEIVQLEDVDSILGDLAKVVYEINDLIRENNKKLANIKAAQSECCKMVQGKMAFDCQETIAKYQGAIQTITEQLKKSQEAVASCGNEIKKLDGVIADLNTKTTNTIYVMKNINKMLDMGGFQGFHLQEKPGARYVYQLVREDGRVAEGLSEGERHIISFLYFYHLVIGSQNDDGKRKNKIVIIDDPVSSMDSTSMALVAQLVRNMVSICYNNYDIDKPDGAEEYIRQFFCLTHNPYFFKEITYNRIADYDCVSFYELKKGAGNHSKVIQCTQEKKTPGGGWENYSPVKNYYDNLWYEYRTTDNPIALSNAMRGILEYYFMQMCGYPTEKLRTALLKVEQKQGVEKNDYDLAYSLLSTLDAGRGRLDVGVDFDSSALNLEQARRVFELIFQLMHQEQHYKLMMGEK